MSKQDEWQRQPDETLTAWAERLRAVSRDSLTDKEKEGLRKLSRSVQAQVSNERYRPARRSTDSSLPRVEPSTAKPASESVLEDIKRKIRALSVEDRQQLIVWLGHGMP